MAEPQTSEIHRKTVLKGLQEIWEQQLCCDASLQASNGEIVQAHKVVLMSCSKYFYTHYRGKPGEVETLSIPEASQDTLLTILTFIYTGTLKLSPENLSQVLELAKTFQLKEVENLCIQLSECDSKEKELFENRDVQKLCDRSQNQNPVENESEVSQQESNSVTIPVSKFENSPNKVSARVPRSCRSTSDSVVDGISNISDSPDDSKSATSSLRWKRRRSEVTQISVDGRKVEKLDSNLENVSGRAKRKCAPPKKLKDFTVIKLDYEKDRNTLSAVPAKRGRGRPRKITKQTNNTTEEKDVVKNPRGRPKGSTARSRRSKCLSDDQDKCSNPDEEGNVRLCRGNDEQDKISEETNTEMTEKSKHRKLGRRKCRTHKCRRCSGEFDTLSLLEKHRTQCKKIVSFDKPDKYKRKRCGKCSIEFPDFASYQEHRMVHMKERSVKLAQKPFVCDVCGQTFRYEPFLACHQFSKHKIPFDKDKYDVMSCPTCDYVTINKWRFKVHVGQHGNQRPFVCDVCGKSFKVSSSLVTHKKTHTQDRRYECEECGKKFLQLSGKEQHVRRIHRKEMSFLCHLCPYKCFVKTELLQHLHKDHQIPLPNKYVRYTCDKCDFMTFRRFHFLNHMNMHEGRRIFECEICHKKYTSKVVLRCHMQFHKEPRHKCPWEGCKYAAVQKRRLDQHIRLIHTHKDDKPFACHICTYRTALNGNLKLHLRNVHHLDIPRRPMLKQKGVTKTAKTGSLETPGQLPGTPSTTLTTINSSDIVSLAVASCEGISPVSTPNLAEEQTETVVIYATDSQLQQVSAAQVLQQLRSGNVTGHVQPTSADVGEETVAIVTEADTIMHLPDGSSQVDLAMRGVKGEVTHTGDSIRRYVQGVAGEVTPGLSQELVQHMETGIRVSQDVSQDTRHQVLVSHDLHATDLQGHPRDIGEEMERDVPRDIQLMRDIQIQELNPAAGRDSSSDMTSGLGRDPQRDLDRDSGLVIQEMMTTQYPSEPFIPDSRNLNLMIQSMDNREGFPQQQTNYWTQY